jgi:MinD-like ATPase involved in chromosome partitioning or flagellar assembly
MALVTVLSAKGAPGATTTAMLLASLWPRPTVLVDADPAGGDIALRLPRYDGRPLDPQRGLLSLLPSARRGVPPELVHDHTQTALGGQPVLAGLSGPEQSLAVGPLWGGLADAFAGLAGADVVVDAGQVHAHSPHLALVDRSDLVVWVLRPTAWSALHTRRRLEGLADHLADSPTRVVVVPVASPDQRGDVVAATTTVLGDWTWVTAHEPVALDPKAVVMFEGGEVFRPERTLLARSGRVLAESLYAELAPSRAARVADGGGSDDSTGPEGGGSDDSAGVEGGEDAGGRRRRLLGRRSA